MPKSCVFCARRWKSCRLTSRSAGKRKKRPRYSSQKKFDAVIIDCDDLRGGLGVLQGLRATPSNKNSVTFAVLNGKKTTTQQALCEVGVNFVLQKPIRPVERLAVFPRGFEFYGERTPSLPIPPAHSQNAGKSGSERERDKGDQH